MTVSVALIMCLLAYVMFFAAGAVIMLITDLLGWTCFWMIGPYNARQHRRYVRNRNNRL